MRRAYRLFRTFFHACLAEEFEYRANFAANLGSTLFSLAMSILTVILFFYRSPSLGGWSFDEVLALLGVFNALHGFVELFLQPNMSRLVAHIRQGTLDFVLLKPVDSQFFVSFRHLVLWRFADIGLGLGLTGYAVWRLMGLPSIGGVLMFGVLFIASLVIIYALWTGMMVMSFWAVKVDNLAFLFGSLFETSRYPVSVYKGALRLALLYVMPIGLVTTVPAEALIGRFDASHAIGALLLSMVFLLAARLLWKRALRAYTSASS
ncbi:ABC transporter permease [Paenibacillus sp. CF384]|uniref:ABC transporter permease n=1 Tax=Paenibacillus sp. CF384 TaxID=1884382 RepID=UPI0008974CFB|nr:ABC-2 family transporter protein [Paenibacillus sp. CF384]SDW54147.1 ABC-2 type transport system permease protein [Paenibacillus sp. CF384]